MASLIKKSPCTVVLFLIIFSSIQLHIVTSTEFEVGGDDGWVLPKSKNDSNHLYNKWASKNRFKMGDTVHFKYKKDSVLVVSEEEYDKCRSSHPTFFSNNGDSVFTFDRPGSFYFISGVAGHCERGQKMIIKVLETESNPPQSANLNSTTDSTKNSATTVEMSSTIIMVLTITILGVMFN